MGPLKDNNPVASYSTDSGLNTQMGLSIFAIGETLPEQNQNTPKEKRGKRDFPPQVHFPLARNPVE
jgi:hypothetical protein